MDSVSSTSIFKIIILAFFALFFESAYAQTTPENDTGVRFPVVTSSDLPSAGLADIFNFVQLDSDNGANVPIYGSPAGGKPIGQIHPGDVVEIYKQASDSPWRQVYFSESSAPESAPQLWFKYDEKAMRMLSNRPELAMKMRSPKAVKAGLTVYRDPGFWNPSDCAIEPEMCAATLTDQSRVYLLRTAFRLASSGRIRKETWLNFYELRIEQQSDDVIGIRGWLPSTILLPVVPEAYLGQQRVVAKPKPLPPPPPPTKEEAELFVLSGNSNSEEQRKKLMKTLGLPKAEAESLKSISSLTLRYDGRVGANYLQVDQPFAGPAYNISAVRAGGSIAVKIFLDLEMRGGLDFSLPAMSSENNAYAKGYYLDTQGDLVYATPWTINEVPIELGAGIYYTSLITQRPIGGLPGVAGFQGKVIFHGEKISFGLRVAPVAQDLSVNLRNRLLGAELSYQLGRRSQGRNYELKLDYTDISYTNFDAGTSTSLKVIGAALMIPFGS
jgi:hypothetical protein